LAWVLDEDSEIKCKIEEIVFSFTIHLKKQLNISFSNLNKIHLNGKPPVLQGLLENTKSLKDLELELEHLIARENDIIDIVRLQKSYFDLSRDTETEFLRKCKSLKEETET